MRKIIKIMVGGLAALLLAAYGYMSVKAKRALHPSEAILGMKFFLFRLFPARRAIDPSPIESIAADRLPPGRAEAWFDIDTGGDQMSLRPVQAGLVFMVRFENKILRQTIASCADVGKGNALGGDVESDLDAALCDGREFRLRTGGGKVIVEEIKDNNINVISEVALPAGIERAVHP